MVGTGFALLGAGAVVRAGLVAAPGAAEPNRWFLRARRGQRRGRDRVAGVPAGSSPRSAASRGPSCGLLLTRDAVQTSGNLWPFFAGARGHLRGGRRRCRATRSACMRRRWAAGDRRARCRTEPDDRRLPTLGGGRAVTVVAACCPAAAIVSTACSAAPTSAPGFWDLTAGGAQRGARARGPDRPRDRPGVGGQPHLADLLPGGALDGVPAGVRRDHDHALHPARHRGVRHRAARVRASPSARSRCARPSSGSTASRSPARR